MAVRMPATEKAWIVVALAIIGIGVGFAIGSRLGYVPAWVGTAATMATAAGAVLAALAAARSTSYRNDSDG